MHFLDPDFGARLVLSEPDGDLAVCTLVLAGLELLLDDGDEPAFALLVFLEVGLGLLDAAVDLPELADGPETLVPKTGSASESQPSGPGAAKRQRLSRASRGISQIRAASSSCMTRSRCSMTLGSHCND